MAKRTNHNCRTRHRYQQVTCVVATAGEESLMQMSGWAKPSRGLAKRCDRQSRCSSRVNQTRCRRSGTHERCAGGRSNYQPRRLAHHGVQRTAIVAVANRDRMITGDDVASSDRFGMCDSLPAGREIVDRLPQNSSLTTRTGSMIRSV